MSAAVEVMKEVGSLRDFLLHARAGVGAVAAGLGSTRNARVHDGND
jgi:hypothetical protein